MQFNCVSPQLRKGPNSFIYHQYLDILQKGILNSTFTPITRYMLYLSTKCKFPTNLQRHDHTNAILLIAKEETTQIPWIK